MKEYKVQMNPGMSEIWMWQRSKASTKMRGKTHEKS